MLSHSNKECSLVGASVNDYVSDREVEQRLAQDVLSFSKKSQVQAQADRVNGTPAWMLQDYDATVQDQNTLEMELRRLRVLKSFAVVGEHGHEPLTRITSMATRLFKTPIAMITLIDLGRVWFFANTGVEGVSEIAREVSICAHTITIKGHCFVITDASKDFRFAEFPLVTGPPNVRFYAGAPLIVPEGYKIGVLCVASPIPRPEGISEDEQKTLVDLAATVVKMLVDRRNLLEFEARQKNAIASVSHEIMTPMTGLQLSLSLLQEDEELRQKMNQRQNELVSVAVGCSEMMIQMYNKVAMSLREENGNGSNTTLTAPSNAICKISELISYLQQVLKAVPMIVPVVLDVDHSIRHETVADESTVFRVALTFLSTACSRAKTGFIRLHIYGKGNRIMFEFEDTAPHVSAGDCHVLLVQGNDRDLCDLSLIPLLNAVSLIGSIKGKHGIRPRSTGTGSVFWFSITACSETSHPHVVPIVHQRPMAVTSSTAKDLRDFPAKGLERSCCPFVDSAISPVVSPEKSALVIDDTLVVRKSLGKLLSSLRYHVASAENGLDGLRHMMRQRFDVVLCDFFMPVLDGLDCVRQFRTWERENRPAVSRQFIVGISAHASGNDAQTGLTAGMDLFHSKPIVPAILKDLDSRVAAKEQDKASNSINATIESCDETKMAHPKISANKRKIEESLISHTTLEQSRDGIVTPEPIELGTRYCLLATRDIESYEACRRSLIMSGWECHIIEDGEEMLRMLQQQNWTAVVVDVAWRSPTDCINQFREWESMHRISRQSNIFLDCSNGSLPDQGISLDRFIQPPWGFDDVLISLAERENFHITLNCQQASDANSTEIIMR